MLLNALFAVYGDQTLRNPANKKGSGSISTKISGLSLDKTV